MLVQTTSTPIRILMVSTEYPPMQGGVGRYTYNLTKDLRKLGLDVQVVCNKLGNGEFSGLSPDNPANSQVLLEIVEKIKPDLVHIQYEHGLYRLKIKSYIPQKDKHQHRFVLQTLQDTNNNDFSFSLSFQAMVQFDHIFQRCI